MNQSTVAVASRSFSRHPILRSELLAKYPNVKFNDEGKKLEENSLISFLSGCQKAILGLEVINDSILSNIPELEVISKYGVGMDKIDIQSLKNHDVSLGLSLGVNRRSVAELAIGFMLNHLRNISNNNQAIKNSIWKNTKGTQLSEKTIGIIGCGNVGKEVIQLLSAFGCNFLVHDLIKYESFYKKYNVKAVTLDELLESSNIVSVHVPLNSSTKHLLNGTNMALMRKDALLINTARGGIVEETPLFNMLEKNEISGAALDVFSIEPPIFNEFKHLENLTITPHIGGSTEESILLMGRAAIDGLDSFVDLDSIEI